MTDGPFEFDPAKNAANRIKHKVGLDDFSGFDGEPVVVPDNRREYSEQRFRAFGRIGAMPYIIAFTLRDGTVRLITFRRAHNREMQRYER